MIALPHGDQEAAGSSGPRPRISFGSWAFAFGPFESNPWTFDRVCRYVADAGYEGIEINGFLPHPHDERYADDRSCATLRSQIDDLGLDISGYAPDFRTTPPADVDTSDFLARIDSTLAFCRRMRIPILRTDSVSAPASFDERRFDHLTDAWRKAADRASDQGVLLVWEFEPGFWLNRPSQVVRTLEIVDHPNFQLLFDTSHAYTGGVCGARQGVSPEILPAVIDYAALVRHRIGHLHLIDSDGSLHDEDTSAHLAFGTGNIDFDGFIAVTPTLLDLPWWTIDFCFNSRTEPEGRSALPFVRSVLDRALLERAQQELEAQPS